MIQKAKDNFELVGSLDESVIKSLEQQGIEIPSIDFWLDKFGLCITNKDELYSSIEREGLILYLNQSVDSRFAAKYVAHLGHNFRIWNVGDAICDKGFGYSYPMLINWKESGFPWNGLKGVKQFVRFDLYKRECIDFKNEPRINSFWEDKSRQISCFDTHYKEIYVGCLKNAPHPVDLIKRELAIHWYNSWNEVISQEVGDWDLLIKMRSKDGEIIDKHTKTVLFADEVEQLKTKKRVVTLADSSYMDVNYTSYFIDGKNKLFRFHANESD